VSRNATFRSWAGDIEALRRAEADNDDLRAQLQQANERAEQLQAELDIAKPVMSASLQAVLTWCNEDCIDESECETCSLNIQSALNACDAALRRCPLIAALAELDQTEAVGQMDKGDILGGAE
jgi:uncharacterized protein YhaN